MPQYRRLRIPGGTYFFTVALRDRRSDALVNHIDALRDAVRETLRKRPFRMDAFVVLPDHLHCLWTLPENDDDFPGRWRYLKTRFSKLVGGGLSVWQKRYWEHAIRDERDFAAHFDYVHFNPVKHGLVLHPADWPYSTFRRAVGRGEYPSDWCGPGRADDVVYHRRPDAARGG
jgi:putative transposase